MNIQADHFDGVGRPAQAPVTRLAVLQEVLTVIQDAMQDEHKDARKAAMNAIRGMMQ